MRVGVFLLRVGHRELHLRRQILHGVQSLADDLNRLGTEVGEECQRDDEEDGRQSRRTYHILQLLHAE